MPTLQGITVSIFCFFGFMAGLGLLGVFGQSLPNRPLPPVKCWEYPLGPDVLAAISADDDSIYFADTNGEVRAIDAKTAESIWKTEIGGSTVSNIAVSVKSLYVATNPESSPDSAERRTLVRKLSKTTGLTDRVFPVPFSEQVSVFESGGLVVAVGGGGTVTVYDEASGEKMWERSFPGGFSAKPSISASTVSVSTTGFEVFLIAIRDGSDLLRYKSKTMPTSLLGLETNRLFYGSESGRLERIGIGNKPDKLKFRAGGQISDITFEEDRLLVSSFDNFLYLVSLDDGHLYWKKRLPGRPAADPVMTRDVAVVSVNGVGAAIFVDLRNGKTINRIEFGDEIAQTNAPVVSGNNRISFSIQGRIVAYALGGCGGK